MSTNIRKDDGTGMTPPPNDSPSGSVTSRTTINRNPRQGLKVDRNRHGIRRETNTTPQPPKKTRPKKV
jgi:hypothetical protein